MHTSYSRVTKKIEESLTSSFFPNTRSNRPVVQEEARIEVIKEIDPQLRPKLLNQASFVTS